jgi:DNA primase
MEISENVLFNTLAQLAKKSKLEINKKYQKESQNFQIHKSNQKNNLKKINVQFQLEQKIIEILLLYGNRSEDFEDLILKENDKGDLILEPVIQKSKVFEKIYLDLQEDEMKFSNSEFKTIYYLIIDHLNQNDTFSIDNFVNKIDPDLVPVVTSILMNEERYNLHNWEKNNIFPKPKDLSIPQLVSETILSLRCYLIDKKVSEFKEITKGNSAPQKDILEDVLNYSNLKMLLSRKLNRVL